MIIKVLLFIASMSLISLTIGCQGNSVGIEKNTTLSPVNNVNSDSSSITDDENTKVLVGHWRNTTIMFENTKDTNLVLDANGTLAIWEVTASSRSQATKGTWNVKGKILTVVINGETASSPFTIYQGQLVYPNIPDQRGFWERVAN
jgi:hypothetical protein